MAPMIFVEIFRSMDSEEGLVMPEQLHRDLDKRAKAMGLKEGSDEYKRYVYGTMAKIEKQKKEKEEVEIPELPE